MILKLCGFTIADQAARAAQLGATHVGIVLWTGSRRGVSIASAHAIADAARRHGAQAVAVVVTTTGPELVTLARDLGARIQLHGDHTLDDAAALREAGVPFWRALRVGADGVDVELGRTWRAAGADAILLDAYVPGAPGGTGARVDREQARQFVSDGATVLAGGLTPDTVADAICSVGPAGVDVASGIEVRPGVKDAAAMERFVEQARAAWMEIA